MIALKVNSPLQQVGSRHQRCRLLPLVACACALSAFAENYDQGPVFSVIEENDLFANTDRHYTQGLKLSYFQCDGEVPAWAQSLSEVIPPWGFHQKVVKFGYQIGQNIYTPTDISLSAPPIEDRPYAGWLYAGLAWQRRGRTLETWPTLESLQLDLGLIGPAALARESQTWIHEVRGFKLPQGWSHQLDNEPGIALKYQRTLRFSAGDEDFRWLDFLPRAGFSVGNAETSVRAGAELRIGWWLPDNFGMQSIDSLVSPEGGWSRSGANHTVGAFAFASVEGKLIGYTSFLDGNLFRSSPSVEREPWVAELRSGFGLTVWRLEGGFAFVYRTREFRTQLENNHYGSLFLNVRF